MPARNHEVTRLEGFSDAVFGFALTLLVVSLEVPSDMESLTLQMEGFLGFALMFAMVCWIWYEHNVFFRRSGLQDPWTVFLNSVLLFVVLFYVYPMKYLTAALMVEFFSLGDPQGPRFGGADDGRVLMMLYSTGVVLIFAVFLLLYRHAWARREDLGFTPENELDMRYGMRAHTISMSVGLTSLIMAVVLPAAFAGMIYFLMGPLHGWNGYKAGKAKSALADPPPAPPPPDGG